MALTNCPECGKEISDKAVSCPNCGYMLKNKSLGSFEVKELRSKLLDARIIALVFVYLGILLGYAGSKVLGIETKSYSIIGYLKEEGPSIPAIILLIVPIVILLCVAFLENISKIIYFAGAGCGLICVIALFVSMGNVLNPNSAPAISEAPKLGFFLELLVWIFIATWTILKEYTNVTESIKQKNRQHINNLNIEADNIKKAIDNNISEITNYSETPNSEYKGNSVEKTEVGESVVETSNLGKKDSSQGIKMDWFDKVKNTSKDVRLIALVLVYVCAFFNFMNFDTLYGTEYGHISLIDLLETPMNYKSTACLFFIPALIFVIAVLVSGRLEKKYIYIVGAIVGLLNVIYIYFATGKKLFEIYTTGNEYYQPFRTIGIGFALEFIVWEFIIIWTILKEFVFHIDKINEGNNKKSCKLFFLVNGIVLILSIVVFSIIMFTQPSKAEMIETKKQEEQEELDKLWGELQDAFADLNLDDSGEQKQNSTTNNKKDNSSSLNNNIDDPSNQTNIKENSNPTTAPTNTPTNTPNNQNDVPEIVKGVCQDFSEINGSGQSFYGIWCGGTDDKATAIQFAQELANSGFNSFVFSSKNWNDLVGYPEYVISVGMFSSTYEANKNLTVVKQYIPDAFVGYSGLYIDDSKTNEISNDNTPDDTTILDGDTKNIKAEFYDLTDISENLSSFYGVWCAASKNKQEAVNIAKALVELGIEGDVLYSENWELFSGLNWYVVSAGRYSSESEANMVLPRVKQHYSGAYVSWTGDFIDYQQSQGEDVGNYTDEDYRIVNMIAYALTNELKEDDLRGYTSFELSAIRNGIFAAHGNVFKTQEWNDYYSRFDWYTPNPAFNQDSLSSVENHNASLIREYEEKTYGTIYKFK